MSTTWVGFTEIVVFGYYGLVFTGGTLCHCALEGEMVVEDVFSIREHPVSEELIGSNLIGIALAVMISNLICINNWNCVEFLA